MPRPAASAGKATEHHPLAIVPILIKHLSPLGRRSLELVNVVSCDSRCQLPANWAMSMLACAWRTSLKSIVGMLLNLRNRLDAVNVVFPVRVRGGSYVGLVGFVELIDNRGTFCLRSSGIESVLERAFRPRADAGHVGTCVCSGITELAVHRLKRARGKHRRDMIEPETSTSYGQSGSMARQTLRPFYNTFGMWLRGIR